MPGPQDTDASGKSGIDDLEKTITDITGQPIDYYIALDFDGFKQIINELGGIKIQVPKDLARRALSGTELFL